MNIRFDGQKVIVTGAAHGFGRALCVGFARLGAQVWGCDILPDELAETRQLCGQAGGECEVRTVDITQVEAVRAFVDEANRDRTPVTVLVNNAGGVLGQVGRPVEDVQPADWQAIFDVNVSGAFYMCQGVVPGMKSARRGRIINIASGAGLGVSLTGIQADAPAKAANIGRAIRAWSKNLPQSIVGEIRGSGALWGIEIVSPGTKTADAKKAKRIQQALFREGVIIYLSGRYGNVVGIVPPLVCDIETLTAGLNRIGDAIAAEAK